MLANKTFKGSAGLLTLGATLNAGAATAQVDGDVSGWPSGADGRLFVMEVDQGSPQAERILCATLSGSGPATIAIATRGWDGTTDQQHQPNAKVLHVFDADTADETVLHIVDIARDDHGQYLSASRHDTPTRHTFGADAALGTPGDPAPVGILAVPGNAESPARWDHVHRLGDGSIDKDTLFAAAVVAEAALKDDAASTRTIVDGAITQDKIADGLALYATADSTATGADLPVGASPLWWQPDKARLFAFIASKWHWVAGKRIKATMSYHVDGNTIAADLPTAHTLNQFISDADELAALSAGGTLTVPVAATNGVAYDGEWRVKCSLLVDNLGATAAAAIEVLLVAGGNTIIVGLGPNAPRHSTLVRGEETVTLAAGQTALLQLALDAGSGAKVLSGSTVEFSYRGPA